MTVIDSARWHDFSVAPAETTTARWQQRRSVTENRAREGLGLRPISPKGGCLAVQF